MVPLTKRVTKVLWPKPAKAVERLGPNVDIEDLHKLFDFVEGNEDDVDRLLDGLKRLDVRDRPAPPKDLATRSPLLSQFEGGAAPLAPSSKDAREIKHNDFTMQLVDTKYGPGVEITGQELLTVLTSGAVAPTRGSVLYGIPIAPAVIPDARLVQLSNLYTRFLFTEFRVSYRPTAAATVNGSILMFGDYDPSQNPSIYTGDGNLRYAYVHNVSEASVWEGQSVKVDDRYYQDLLYIDANDELRWCVQGNFWALAAGNLPANTEFGKLFLDYKIVMAVPDMGSTITNPPQTQGTVCTVPIGGATYNTAGTPFQFTRPAGMTDGLYLMIVRVAPSTGTIPVLRANLDAVGDNSSPALNFQPGCAFWVKMSQNNGCNLCLQPVVSYGNGNPPAGWVCSYNTIATATSFTADFFGLQTPYIN